MFEEILKDIKNIASLDGTTHDSSLSKEKWSKFIEVHPTKEAAIFASNSESVKKHRPFVYPKGMNKEKVEDKSVEKYVDDLLKRVFNG